MEVYRVTRMLYLDDLTGEGSRRHGGRWNHIGTPALYAASHRSLAMLEALVYTTFRQLTDYGLAVIHLPDEAPVLTLTPEDLPYDWDAFPSRHSTAQLGTRLLQQGRYLAFRVPSSLLPEEQNIVINPLHPLMRQVQMASQRRLTFNERFKHIMS